MHQNNIFFTEYDTSNFIPSFSFDCPVNEEDAKRLSLEYVNYKYRVDFSDYTIDVELLNEMWVISYSENQKNVLGGGAPVVKIDCKTGEILSCLLQQ